MDFAYTPQQEALRNEVRRFIAEHVTVMSSMRSNTKRIREAAVR